MKLKAAYLAAISLCVMVCARAQDPTKVAANQYKRGPENKYVKMVYIHYAPHAKSVMHEHPAGVVVNVTDGHLRFTEADGKTREISALRGEARYFPATKHTVENLSDTSYDGVYIVVKCAGDSAAAHKKRGREEDPVMAALLLAPTNGTNHQHLSGKTPAPANTATAP